MVAEPQRVSRKCAAARSLRYKVKTRAPETRIGDLSGGNVQRAVLARELSEGVEILIAADPVFELDFAAVAQIHAEIMAARNNGAAVLLVSQRSRRDSGTRRPASFVMFHGAFVFEGPAAGPSRPHRDRPPHGRALVC